MMEWRSYTPGRARGRTRCIPPQDHPGLNLLGFRAPQSPGRLQNFGLALGGRFATRLTSKDGPNFWEGLG